jgi:hypothetical protein
MNAPRLRMLVGSTLALGLAMVVTVPTVGGQTHANRVRASSDQLTVRSHASLTLTLLHDPAPIFARAAPSVLQSETLTQVGAIVLSSALSSTNFTQSEKSQIRSALGLLKSEPPPSAGFVSFIDDERSQLLASSNLSRPLHTLVGAVPGRFSSIGARSGTPKRYADIAWGEAASIVRAGNSSLYTTTNPVAGTFYRSVASNPSVVQSMWGRSGKIVAGTAVSAFVIFLAAADGSGALLGAANVVPIHAKHAPAHRCTSVSSRCTTRLIRYATAHALASSWGALFDGACRAGKTSLDRHQCPKPTEAASHSPR